MISLRHVPSFEREMLRRLPKLARYSSSYSPSQTVLNNNNENDTIMQSILTKMSNSEPEEAFKLYHPLLKTKSQLELSQIASTILSEIKPTSGNEYVFLNAMRTIQLQDITGSLLKNMQTIIPKLEESGKPYRPSQQQITKFALLLAKKDPTIVSSFEKSMGNIETKDAKSLLVSMYLQAGEITKAYEFVVRSLTNNQRLHSSSLELVIHHLCHLEDVRKASKIIDLANANNYELYPRTLSTFLTKAIELADVEVCKKHYLRIVNKTYIDNGSLMNLIELLSDVLYLRELKYLYSVMVGKGSAPLIFVRRYRRCLVESRARRRGFERAFRYLRSIPHPQPLLVADYPQLLNKIAVSNKLRKIEFNLNKAMKFKMSIKLKRFYLNLVVAKLVEKNSVDLAIEALRSHITLRRYISEETMMYIVRAVQLNPDIFILDALVKLILDCPNLRVKRSFIADSLLQLVIESQYWFHAFKIWEKIKIKDYKMDIKLLQLLATRSKANGFEEQFNKIISV